jgi:hypothetical protein
VREALSMISLDWNGLQSMDAPWAYQLASDERTVDSLFLGRMLQGGREVIRILRGKRCPNAERLFQECAAALQFPYYFGENWDAMSDCLRDLEWLPGGSYVLFVTNVNLLLADDPTSLSTFLSILTTVQAYWDDDVTPDSRWSRPRVPFRVIFHCEPAYERSTIRRFETIDVHLAPLKILNG